METKKFTLPELMGKLSENWPEAFEKTNPLIVQIYRIRDHFYEAYRKDLAPFDIQHGEFDVLTVLRIQGEPYESSPTEIYRSLMLSSGGLTKILNRLEKKALIRRPPNPKDKRSSLVRLTQKGKTVVESVTDRVLATENRFLSFLTEREREAASLILGRLLAATERAAG